MPETEERKTSRKTSERENTMKVYIVTYRNVDCEGNTWGFPMLYKIFLNREAADRAMRAEKERRAWTTCGWKIEEHEVEEAE